MGERSDEMRDVARSPAAAESGARPAATAEEATVAGADPFASTLTVPLASAVPQGPQLEPGRELGPVRLVREIGRGATGAVFQGHHTVLGRDVAVKFLIHVPAGRSGDEGEGIKRFVDEARAAASVRHPNLTQIFHADVDGGTPYLVLEYVRGPTLRQLLEHAGFLGVEVTATAMTDVAAAVAELHARGIIHRDIKPSNALVDADGRVCVTDFGLAVRRSQQTAVAGASPDIDFAGTPAYMAPEMFEGRISARSDVYAMGVMAFQLLSGSTPFSGAFHELREKHAHEPLPSLALRDHGVGPGVVEVIERATHKQAMFRYKGAPDFARALREAAGLGAPELARARKQLCDLVAGRAVSAAESGADGAGTTGGEVRGPRREPADDSDSTLYTQTISRIATSKRERRRNPLGDSDGSSVTPLAAGKHVVAEPPPLGNGGTSAVSSTPQAAPGSSPVPGTLPQASPATGVEKLIPPPVLFVGVSGIVYGSLVALWVIGLMSGRGNLSPDLPPATGQTIAVVAVLVVAAVLYFFLQVALVAISAASLRLRPLARRLMVIYAITDLVLQLSVLALAVTWIEPARVRALAAAGVGAPAAVLWTWVVQWLLLSVFPLAALYVMRRRDVRSAFEAAAAPRPDADFPQPAF